jgi:hypothetical protein
MLEIGACKRLASVLRGERKGGIARSAANPDLLSREGIESGVAVGWRPKAPDHSPLTWQPWRPLGRFAQDGPRRWRGWHQSRARWKSPSPYVIGAVVILGFIVLSMGLGFEGQSIADPPTPQRAPPPVTIAP